MHSTDQSTFELLLRYGVQGSIRGGCVSLQTKIQFPVSKLRFQNEYNKVVIALRVGQFWSEIKLVITNRTPATRSCDFVITRLISDQIALHSVQLPLFIVIKQPRITTRVMRSCLNTPAKALGPRSYARSRYETLLAQNEHVSNCSHDAGSMSVSSLFCFLFELYHDYC